MNKEQIQDRIKTLIDERDKLRVSLIAHEGALQDCNYWLDQLDKATTNDG